MAAVLVVFIVIVAGVISMRSKKKKLADIHPISDSRRANGFSQRHTKSMFQPAHKIQSMGARGSRASVMVIGESSWGLMTSLSRGAIQAHAEATFGWQSQSSYRVGGDDPTPAMT